MTDLNVLSKSTNARIREIVKKIEQRLKDRQRGEVAEYREYYGLTEFDTIEEVLKEELQ